ncbi:MAG: ABC transporter permease, partial [Acidimicrobiia bacterium]|nr:ABC transporter permease [Acidimicrobiia bacterium]
RMHDFGTGLPDAGLVAGRSLGALLDIDVGDTVTITRTDRLASLELSVVEFVDEPLGTMVYAEARTVESLTASSPTTSVLVSFADGADREVMRRRIAALPGVVAYVDSRSLYDTAQSLLSLFYAFVGVMLAFGALMAFALLFNTTTVNTSERSPELAAMKVNGASTGQLAKLVAGENLLLTALSIIPGLAIGYWVSAVFMNSFTSDLFDFGLQIRARTLILSAVAVLVVSALAQWPASHTIASLDVARVVRERSQ